MGQTFRTHPEGSAFPPPPSMDTNDMISKSRSRKRDGTGHRWCNTVTNRPLCFDVVLCAHFACFHRIPLC